MTETRYGRQSIDAELQSVAARLRASTVQVLSRGGHGSGLIADGDGTVLTNAHVARGRKAQIIFADGTSASGEVTAHAPEVDLAAIRVSTLGAEPVVFRDAATLRPGDVVMAAGNPLDLVGAITAGIIHRSDPRGRRVIADVQLLPGNSGGPLADARGHVVGVNAMVVDGLAVAIGSAVVRRFLAAPQSKPYLGVVTQPVVVEIARERRLGLLITEVVEATPAARAGLRTGQVIIGVDGRLFTGPGDLFEEIQSSRAGATLRLDVVEAGRVGGIEVMVGETPRVAEAA